MLLKSNMAKKERKNIFVYLILSITQTKILNIKILRASNKLNINQKMKTEAKL